jgi:hypothetical protein
VNDDLLIVCVCLFGLLLAGLTFALIWAGIG